MNPKADSLSSIRYTELCASSHYSFLASASSPEELVTAAHDAGYAGLAITDEASLAGVVKAHVAAKALNFPLIIGSHFFIDSPLEKQQGGPNKNHLKGGLHLLVLATNIQSYHQLSSLISKARRAAPKGEYKLTFEQFLQGVGSGQVILVANPDHPAASHHIYQLKETFKDRFWIGLGLHYAHADQDIFDYAQELKDKYKVPWVALGQVQMHSRERLTLLRAMTAIRLKTTIQELGFASPQNGEMYIRPLDQVHKTYPEDALLNTQKIHYQCQFSLDELKYLYPRELVPADHTPTSYLRQEVTKGMSYRWPQGAEQHILGIIEKELRLIEALKFEYYFLTVYDIVRFARSENILCQGRGSAANSVVCFCLGITEVDPHKIPVLFERFISKERHEPPDIDVDFEHHRREEVIQYVYKKYGRHRAAILSTIITYRPKSAIRDLGKALGFDEFLIQKVSKEFAWWDKKEHLQKKLEDSVLANSVLEKASPRVRAWMELVSQLLRQPRHLSQHVGGFFIAHHNAEQIVPIENASMKDRTIIQWDKDDVEALGLLKVDLLALGMLSALHKAFDYVALHRGQQWTMAKLPQEDPKVYDMLCKGESLGVFQVESRAQMAMLPRLQPRTFYDLVVQVAIVRPGPIQGKMVHPYLARRERQRHNKAPLEFPSPAIEQALGRTLGVPIFQEQVLQLAVLAAGFSPGEADALRRSMASWRKAGELEQYQQQLREGLAERGYSEDFAERIIEQIKGFGAYGFPESHAASFSLLVYASAWLKCHEPEAFYTALLNSQPMGFYSPSQIIQEARRQGIEVLPVDITQSQWDHTIVELPFSESSGNFSTNINTSQTPKQPLAIRLGMRIIKGLKQSTADRIVKTLQSYKPKSYDECIEITGLKNDEREAITAANGFHAFFNRHQAHWQSEYFSEAAPLLSQETFVQSKVEMADQSPEESCLADYQATGLTLGKHPMHFLRDHPRLKNCKTHEQLTTLHNRGFARVAGIITGRQRPGSASGTLFMTLEDETGNTNVIIWPQLIRRRRQAVLHSKLVIVKGTLERKDSVMHLVAGDIEDISDLLAGLPNKSRDFH